MKETASGSISRVGQNGKSFQLVETDDKWYGAFNATQLAGATVGNSVSFFYESVSKGDRTFHNIKGNVTVSGGATVPPGGASAMSPSLSRDRLILRQNALTNAVNAMSLIMKEGGTFSTDEVIAIAKDFEAYTSGDADADVKESGDNSEPTSEDWQEAAGKLRAAT